MGAIRKYLLIAVVMVCFEGIGRAELKVKILYNILNQTGNGGKQVYDGSGNQDLTVYQPMLLMDYQIDHNTSFSGSILMDTFSGASDHAFDAHTGASGSSVIPGGANLPPDITTGASTVTPGTTTPPPDVTSGASTVATGTGSGTAAGTGTAAGGDDDQAAVTPPSVTTTPPATPTDTTTGASKAQASGAAKAPAATSTASDRKWETRKAFDFSLSKKIKTWVLIPSFGYSTEADYESVHGGMTVNKSFAEDNFTLSAGVFHYDDRVQFFDLSAGAFAGWRPKTTDSVNLAASQLLGRSDIVLVGGSLTRQSGLLSSNRNTEDLNGTRVAEILPGERNKVTGTLRLIHGLNDYLALHADYRYYTDDWDLVAHTVEPSLCLGFGEDDNGLVRVLYRYYTQNAARYYKDRFTASERYMTSDSDLAAFSANEVGLQGSYAWNMKGFIKTLELGGGVIYYVRSDDLKATVYQLSLSGRF